ncbi:MAG: hypothetical protein GF388_06980 [Candidatus Aegiribacteria sp.]|nr:hypothetical protein [Candidatus Aegiribacteria sp.]
MANTVEKEIDGVKRRYLTGISSGSKWDAHGERMTEECVKDFVNQAKSGDVLLYPDAHGIKASEDIGILSGMSVRPDGDWFTEYRLYDAHDQVDDRSVQVADKLWKQINGLPPYKTKKQKGFSIEGYVPDDGILEETKDGGRVLNKVVLDGVLLVPRPAYTPSVAQAVYKALGIDPPWQRSDTIQGRLKSKLLNEEIRDSYYRRRYQIQDTLDSLIQEIMTDEEIDDKRSRLSDIFDEYKALMVELILKSDSIFEPEEPEGTLTEKSVEIFNGLIQKSCGIIESVEKLLKE